MTPAEMIAALITLGYDVGAFTNAVAVGPSNEERTRFYVQWVRFGDLRAGGEVYTDVMEAVLAFETKRLEIEPVYERGEF